MKHLRCILIMLFAGASILSSCVAPAFVIAAPEAADAPEAIAFSGDAIVAFSPGGALLAFGVRAEGIQVRALRV